MAEAAKAKAPEVEKFTVASLRENCKEAFKVNEAIFNGAFYGEPDSSLFSKEEASSKISQWLKKPIK